MLSIANRYQILIAALLVSLLIATRGHHFATAQLLPGASWAVMFLAGVYLRPVWVLPALLAFIWGLDVAPYLIQGMSLADVFGGANVFCLSPSYGFLWPAYSCLWLAGRWYAKQHEFQWATLWLLTTAVLVGTAFCEVFSSGGFYFFSGRFAEPTLSEFAARFVRYFPGDLQSIVFYVALAVVCHALFKFADIKALVNKSKSVS